MPLPVSDHDREVQTFTILKGAQGPAHHSCGPNEGCGREGHDHLEAEPHEVDDTKGLERSLLLDALNSLSKESIWRVKGFVRLLPEDKVYILNWAFGRYELELCGSQDLFPPIQLTVMGRRGEMKKFVHRFAGKLGAIRMFRIHECR